MIILSHTLSSEELASYNIPIVAIEREDKHICSVNTDNYMGGVQATSLLAKSGADILIHINADISPSIPSYGRIKGFLDTCTDQNLRHELILTDTANYRMIIKSLASMILQFLKNLSFLQALSANRFYQNASKKIINENHVHFSNRYIK